MAEEVSDESDDTTINNTNESNTSDMLEYGRETMVFLSNEEERGRNKQQRLNNNEVGGGPMDLTTRPPSSVADDDSGDSLSHKFILEQLRAQKLYSPSVEVSINYFVGLTI